jgi:signal transduction histidine kinase/ActR/RegA family two-component response regulator
VAVPIRRIIGAVPLVIALLIAVAVPLGYFVDRWYDQTSALVFEARLGAGQVARYVYAHPTMWQYHGLRIAEVIALPEDYPAHQWVRDAGGRVVLENGPPIEGPTLQAVAPIVVAGNQVGKFTVASSLYEILTALAMATGACWLVAAGVFLAVRRLPIRALDRALDEVARQRGRFEAAVENMSQGLCMVDAEHRIVVLNRGLVEMFDLTRLGSLIGMNATEAAEMLDRQGGLPSVLCRQLFLPETAGGVQAHCRFMLAPEDGRTVTLDRCPMAQGGWLTTVKDVSDQVRADLAETEAAMMRDRARHAQDASLAKSMFLATMSHEVRTPMNGILGLAGALLDEELTADQCQVVTTIRDSGNSLMRILNDILEFSKLEAGHVVFESLPFSPAVVAKSVVDMLGARAQEKGLRLNSAADPETPAWVVGDAGRIRQMLLNLAGNAIKFTSHGQVDITLRCLSRIDALATLEWRVRDSGIGIDPDELGRLFRDFAQADASIGRRFGGSGLGLAICKRLVEQMGGTIGAESVPGGGSTFGFRLTVPLTPAGAPAEPPRRDFVGDLGLWLRDRDRRPRVLLAEDNPTNQFVLRRMLLGLGLEMDAVMDGAEAVTAAAAFPYGAIFMDVLMPRMDGLEATRAIRMRGGVLSSVPIIALTGNAFAEDRQACLAAGMDDFLVKPLNKEALAEALLRALAHDVLPDGRSAGGPRGRSDPADARACAAVG